MDRDAEVQQVHDLWRMIIALLWLDVTKKAWKISRESYFYK